MRSILKKVFFDSWFHITWFILLIIILITWSPGLDKIIGLSLISFFFTILIVGKYRSFLKKERYDSDKK